MNSYDWYIGKFSPDTAAWLVVLIIVLSEFHYIKDFLVFVFLKLYEFFIQRNAEKL